MASRGVGRPACAADVGYQPSIGRDGGASREPGWQPTESMAVSHHRPRATPRGGRSSTRTSSPRTSAQRIPGPGHGAPGVVRAVNTSRVVAGYAAASVAWKRRAISRVAAVERRTSNRLIEGSSARKRHISDEGKDSALSCAQRICCSNRSMRDWISVATATRKSGSSRTMSTNPRAGRNTATSTDRRQVSAAIRKSSSPIRAWTPSRTFGPVVG